MFCNYLIECELSSACKCNTSKVSCTNKCTTKQLIKFKLLTQKSNTNKPTSQAYITSTKYTK